MDTNLALDLASIESTIKTRIEKGELINQPTMVDISQYLKDNFFVKVTSKKEAETFQNKVKHIIFSELQSSIIIKNSIIEIPLTEIQSSAMDINLYGTHTFDNKIDYHFNFRINQILNSSRLESEYGYVIDDGTGYRVFLNMNGTVSNPVTSMDGQARKEYNSDKRKVESETIKNILKGDYKQPEKNNSPIFQLEDENTNNNPSSSEEKKKKSGFLNKILGSQSGTGSIDKPKIEVEE